MPSALHVQAWAASDTGRVRQENQDSYLVDPELGLYIVADGMGGSERGEVASELACSAIKERLLASREILDQHEKEPSPEHASLLETLLAECLQNASHEIHRAASALTTEGRHMGTTLDAVLISADVAFTAHVGDSRIWLLRDNEARQITEDHTLVQERIRRGTLTQEQARSHHQRNVVTRALGVFESVMVDSLRIPLSPGDRLILASDGLYRHVEAHELAHWVENTAGNVAVDALVDLSNRRGGRDNITVLLAEMKPTEEFEARDQSGPVPDHMNALRRCELFVFCTWRELAKVASACHVRDLPPGAFVFREEDTSRECYIVYRGQVRLTRGGTVMAEIGESGHFGEMSLIDIPLRHATATALTPVRLLVLSHADFNRLLREDTALAVKVSWRLMQYLVRTLRTTMRMVPQIPSSAEPTDEDQ